jgi:hypothetical protein
MAKVKVTVKDSIKVNFGTRKKGKAIKKRNKHDRKNYTYIGQGK